MSESERFSNFFVRYILSGSVIGVCDFCHSFALVSLYLFSFIFSSIEILYINAHWIQKSFMEAHMTINFSQTHEFVSPSCRHVLLKCLPRFLYISNSDAE